MNARKGLFIVLSIVLSSVSAFSTWTKPVPVTEVNTEFEEWSPFLSFDGLTLYFGRVLLPNSQGQIFEATRDEPVGPFTNVREVPGTLNSFDGVISCPWVSPDNLRMYYYVQPTGTVWKLMFSERTTTSSPWPAGSEISELSALGLRLTSPKLTEDELIIVYQAPDRPGGQHDICIATRSRRDLPFEHARVLSEVCTAFNEAHPYISPDGLELYFVSNRVGLELTYKAIRTSRDLPFSNVEHVSFLDNDDECSTFPFITSDAKTFYFVRYSPSNRSSRNIYVSYYYPDNSYFVDAGNGDDLNSGSSPQAPLATIQKAIDTVPEGYTIFVKPGVYPEPIDFKGKAVTLQGIAGPEGVPVLEAVDDFAVSFINNEGPDSVLKNIVIKNSFMAVFVVGSSPTISNVTIVDNIYGINAYAGGNPDISNCIFWNNYESDLHGCEAQYSWVQSQLESYSTYRDIPGLVHYWPINEGEDNTINDIVSDKNGNIYGAAWTDGINGAALSFDGIDDYVTLPDNDSIWLPQNNFTVSVWIYFERDTDFPTNEVILDLNYANSDNSSNELGYNLLFFAQNHPRQLAFQMHTTSTTDEDLSSNFNIIPNRWYHITIVRNGTSQSMYINGQLSATRQCSADPIKFVGGYDDNKVNIGRFTTTIGSPRYHFKGKLDEISIFNRALSDNEIVQLYNYCLDIVADPLFVDPNNGDYHLKSERGRYWTEHDVWVLDKVTSPGIDSGDPLTDFSDEPMPNGGRINLGAFGGTAYASMNDMPFPEPDYNKDGIINESDLADLIDRWLAVSGWVQQ